MSPPPPQATVHPWSSTSTGTGTVVNVEPPIAHILVDTSQIFGCIYAFCSLVRVDEGLPEGERESTRLSSDGPCARASLVRVRRYTYTWRGLGSTKRQPRAVRPRGKVFQATCLGTRTQEVCAVRSLVYVAFIEQPSRAHRLIHSATGPRSEVVDG